MRSEIFPKYLADMFISYIIYLNIDCADAKGKSGALERVACLERVLGAFDFNLVDFSVHISL